MTTLTPAERVSNMPPQIELGDSFPSHDLTRIDPASNQEVTFCSSDLFAGRKVVLITLPEAGSIVCSQIHLPSILAIANDINEAGYQIFCLAANTASEMHQWSLDIDPGFRVKMIPDPDGLIIEEAGIGVDETEYGLGFVARRGVMIWVDGVLKAIQMEDDNDACEVSHGNKILNLIQEVEATLPTDA